MYSLDSHTYGDMIKTEVNLPYFFEHLDGQWKLQRKLGSIGTMEGIACFSLKAPGMYHYKEEGVSRMGSRSFKSYREYLYLFREKNVLVQYWEPRKRGEELYTLTMREEGIFVGQHLCGCDTYQVQYQMLNERELKVTSQVRGPKKAYILQDYLEKM